MHRCAVRTRLDDHICLFVAFGGEEDFFGGALVFRFFDAFLYPGVGVRQSLFQGTMLPEFNLFAILRSLLSRSLSIRNLITIDHNSGDMFA